VATVNSVSNMEKVHTVVGEKGIRATVSTVNNELENLEILLPTDYPKVVDLKGVDFGDLLDVLHEVEHLIT